MNRAPSFPLISVIMPAYNAQATIRKCIESVFQQDYPDLELIIVDDASTDNTLREIDDSRSGWEKFALLKRHIKVIAQTSNKGSGHSRNRGAEAASGEILLFIDSDIVIDVRAVRKAAVTLATKPGILAVGGVYSDNTKGFNFISDFKNLDLAYRCSLCIEQVKYLGSFFLGIRRDVFFSAAGFSENFLGASAEDIEFGYRLSQGKNIMYINKDIAVDHLKIYSLASMLATDAKRIFSMTEIIRQSRGKYRAGEHAPWPYIINIFLPPALLMSVLIGIVQKNVSSTLFIIGFFVINNYGFMFFVAKRRKIIFAIKSMLVLLIEYLWSSLIIFLSFLHWMRPLPECKKNHQYS